MEGTACAQNYRRHKRAVYIMTCHGTFNLRSLIEFSLDKVLLKNCEIVEFISGISREKFVFHVR